MEIQRDSAPKSFAQSWLGVVIQLGMGVYFTYNIVTGNLANYINARFVWLSYVAAALFFVMGFFHLYRIASKKETVASSYTFSNPQTTLSWSILLFGAMPLIFGTMVPSTPLGAEAINGGISTRAVQATNETTFSIAPEKRNILDWLRTFGSSTDLEAFNGQPADVIGFVYKEPTFGEDHFMVARFTMSCCVADASAIGLPVQSEQAQNLSDGVWVRVQGTMRVGEFGEDIMPIIQPTSIEEIEQPEHPYLYP